MKYSKSTSGFYSQKIHSANIPHDAAEITDEYYFELLNGQSAGKIIIADNTGYPVLSDRPPMEKDKLESHVRLERNKRVLCAIDIQFKYEREQESISRGITVTNPTMESDYIVVLQYLQDLFDIPQQPGFPWDGIEDPECPWPSRPDFVLDKSIV